jgi:hypothetical protein
VLRNSCLVASHKLLVKIKETLTNLSVFHLQILFDFYSKTTRLLSFSLTPIFIGISLLLTTYVNRAIALSSEVIHVAETTNVINGTAPYLSFDGGKTKILGVDDIFWMSYQVGNQTFRYTLDNNTSSQQNPILLPESIKTFADINSIIPKNHPIPEWAEDNGQQIEFNSRYDRQYFFDDDGDEILSGAGMVSLKIFDEADDYGSDDLAEWGERSYKRSDLIDPCRYSYRMVLLSSISSVLSKFGVPSRRSFGATVTEDEWNEDPWAFEDRLVLHIKPAVSNPYACWAYPLTQPTPHSEHIGNEWVASDLYRESGAKKGYQLQNINSPSANFPTTAGDSFPFNLTVAGSFPHELSYSKQPKDSIINLTIRKAEEFRYYGNYPNEATITLLGPKAGQPNTSFSPTTFIIYADQAQTKPIYSFTINKWFILLEDGKRTFKESREYCESIGYRLPTVPELTNVKNVELNWHQGYPTGKEGFSKVQLGGGIIPEWGSDVFRLDRHIYRKFWSNNRHKNDNYYLVDAYGLIFSEPITEQIGYALCISP